MMLVPSATPGIMNHCILYSYDDAAHGYGHITSRTSECLLMPLSLAGRDLEIMRGRLGPGRIHHAIRCIGGAERAVTWLINRFNNPRNIAFGKSLSEHGLLLEWFAKAWIEIEASHFIVLNATLKIDQKDAKIALTEIAEAKVKVPQMTALA
ncbi:hypothetical protein LTR93_011132 [Exophiala xenobiotica]|nr:hypothetical protein LTR93_011132 [Exophiala xenobiotica]